MRRGILSATSALAILSAGTGAQQFSEVSAAAGVSFTPKFYSVQADPMQSWMAGNVSIVDYNNDGWDDMSVMAGDAVNLKLFRNEANGTFTNVAKAANMIAAGPYSLHLWGDTDNDGDVDMLLLAYDDVVEGAAGAKGPGGAAGPGSVTSGGVVGIFVPGADQGLDAYVTKFFTNQGDGTFIEQGKLVGLDRAGRTGGAMGDLDKDGWLDISTCSWAGDNHKLYYNRGDGTFMDRTPSNMTATKARGFDQHMVDFDKDGDVDILQMSDFGDSILWRREAGSNKWTRHWHGQLGIGIDENGMGNAVADYDNDGWFDWFTTAIYSDVELPFDAGELGNRLYHNNGDGTFTDVTDAAGLVDGGWGWGTAFADIDNNGWQDIVHANGWMMEKYFDDLLRVYMNQGDGTFLDLAAPAGIHDTYQGRGLGIFDYNHDGKVDFVTNNRDVGLKLYRNETPAAGNWIEISLNDPDSNHFGIGATIKVRKHATDPGTLMDQYRLIEAGSHYMSQQAPRAWVGLGAVNTVVVDVSWVDGTVSHTVVTANQRVTITKP